MSTPIRQISSTDAAMIAAYNADSLDDAVTGKGKAKRGASVRASTPSAQQSRQRQSAADSKSEFLRDMEWLTGQLLQIESDTQSFQTRYLQLTGGSDSGGSQSVQRAGSQFVHDAQDFDKNCGAFFDALKTDYENLGAGDLDGASAIAEINDLMFKLAVMFQELRNIVQKAKELFDRLSWDITVTGVSQKKLAIKQTKNAAYAAAISGIVAGTMGTVLSFAGIFPKFGEALSILGQSTGKISEQAGALISARGTAKADTTRTLAGLIEQSAEQFHKDINDAYSRAAKTSSDMISLLTELVSLHRALLAALAKS